MSRSTRPWRLIAVVLSLALLASACGKDSKKSSSSSTNSDAKSVSLAYVGPKTGDAANLGINILNGAKLAVKEANAAQSKVKFVLKEFDTQGDPAQAPGQLAKYKDDASILGLVGPAFSGETKAVLPDLQNAGLVMISASATNAGLPTIVNPETVFHRALPDDAAQAAGIAKYLKATASGKSVFYIDDNSEYGKGLADELQTAATANGNPNKGHQTINKADDLYSAAVNAAVAAKPDYIFYGGYYGEAGKLKKQLGDAKSTALFVSGDGSLDPGFITAAGSQADGAIITCPCNLATDASPGALGKFSVNYKKEFNQESGTYSAEAYDAANILIKGIEAGNNTRPKLLAYVEGLPSYAGISKTIEFAENGNLKATGVFLFTVKNGKFAPLANTDKL